MLFVITCHMSRDISSFFSFFTAYTIRYLHVCVLLLRCILYGNPYIFDDVCYTIFHGVSCVSYRSGLLDDAVVISRDILCEIHPILDASMGFAFQQNYLIYLYPSYRPLFFFESLVMGNAMMILETYCDRECDVHGTKMTTRKADEAGT
eukprot:74511_1